MSNTPETKSFYVTAFDVEEWAEKCIRLEKERDEAREKAERYRLEANAIMMQRDEAREQRDKLKQLLAADSENVDAYLGVCMERDEARNEILGWENKWKCAVDMAARAELERDDAFNKLKELKDILR